MMGKERNRQSVRCSDPMNFANNLNSFYARFDDQDYSKECDDLCAKLEPSPIVLAEKEVVGILAKLNPYKSPGPDGLRGRVLKECSQQLGKVLTRLFQTVLETSSVPRVWRTSIITPVPKKPKATNMNDFRPIALTSVLCKCMERIICRELITSVSDRLDPLQFAYRAKRGVEDATLTILHTITQHLDTTGKRSQDFVYGFQLSIQHHPTARTY